ncbi:DUF4374 domain-containing protein [Myroides sp. NP-2]|uniref:DUF4374 domain-containing protein n=1 Tax=Myroides sp. NP-2 TaxID=2759945 RepID=UPI0015F911A0|nr:DUF4374 domain-containing protein [Myroides sp. NP-2]MBB1150324.1 DUF4374 domain-containing protein [Myroides sp. NP-2]
MKISFLKTSVLFAGLTLCAVGCSSDDQSTSKPIKPGEGETETHFQLAYASGSGSQSATYLQGVTSLSEGEVSFKNAGYQMPSSRTSRIFVSEDGKYVYNLNYTVGDLRKYEHQGGQVYKELGNIDSSPVIGTSRGRFTKINEKLGSIHHAEAKAQYANADGSGDYLGHKITASIALIDLENWSFLPGSQKEIDVKLDAELVKKGYFINRIDAPVLVQDKLYYGTRIALFDETTGKTKPVDLTFTLVVDKNNLSNAKIISTNHVIGSTNGYRTPAAYVNERQEVLQMVNGSDKTYIARIVQGQYDHRTVFDLGQALGGKKVSSNGWFYVGNGIGYVPYEKMDEAEIEMGVDKDGKPTTTHEWGLARVDLNNNTAIDLEVPQNLWLTQYQTAAVRDGKFYIALAPVSGQGNIYIYTISSTSPKGEKGAVITSGVDQYYIGVY